MYIVYIYDGGFNFPDAAKEVSGLGVSSGGRGHTQTHPNRIIKHSCRREPTWP